MSQLDESEPHDLSLTLAMFLAVQLIHVACSCGFAHIGQGCQACAPAELSIHFEWLPWPLGAVFLGFHLLWRGQVYCLAPEALVFRLVGFYSISTFVGYFMPNLFLYKLSVLFQTIWFSMSTQFNRQKHLYFKLLSLLKQF